MTGRIYLLDGNSNLTAMEEAPYDSEKLLQEMVANLTFWLTQIPLNFGELSSS